MSESLNFNASAISTGAFIGNGAGINITASNVQVFQGPGAPVVTGGTFTWIKPTTGSMVLIECWGGGGGGGDYGGGGGGGGYNYGYFPMAIFPGPAVVLIGDGGAAASSPSTAGSPGLHSNVSLSPTSNLVTGWGGGGGTGGTPPATTGPGGGGGGMAGMGGPGPAGGLQGGGVAPTSAGGIPQSSLGVIFGGGCGGRGAAASPFTNNDGSLSTYGGGGGGGFKTVAPAVAPLGGTSVFGGSGGTGGNPLTPGAATDGVIPGGGGGGGYLTTSKPAAPGASGQVRITTF